MSTIIPDLEALEKRLGLTFGDKDLLRQALVHRSYLNEAPGFPLPSNERLEFLGDAVLGFWAAEHLYRTCPHLSEGELTPRRAALVRAESLARLAKRLDLGSYLYLGRGEEASGGRTRSRILAAALEALVGAIFLDQGPEAAKDFLLKLWEPELARVIAKDGKDYKSLFQELAQARYQLTPTYRTVAAAGPDHAKVFTVEVLLGDRLMGQGRGKSKQEAEQQAAKEALESWDKGG